jgi:midasin
MEDISKMVQADMIHDPLKINLPQQIRVLAEITLLDSQLHDTLLAAPTRSELLQQLSRALLNPRYTLAVSNAFRPLLLDLCARWLEDDADEEDKLEALCLLLDVHPELFPYVTFTVFPRGFLMEKFL